MPNTHMEKRLYRENKELLQIINKNIKKQKWSIKYLNQNYIKEEGDSDFLKLIKICPTSLIIEEIKIIRDRGNPT